MLLPSVFIHGDIFIVLIILIVIVVLMGIFIRDDLQTHRGQKRGAYDSMNLFGGSAKWKRHHRRRRRDSM